MLRIGRSTALWPAALLLCGCGYVGDPLPPALNIPVAVSDLDVIQRGELLAVQFTVPAMTTDGTTLENLGSVDLRIGSLPDPFSVDGWSAAATPVPVAATEPGRVQVEIPARAWVGKEVLIAVRASNPRGRFSEWSNLETLTVLPPLKVPADVKAEPHPEGIRLSWSGDAPEYRIYRAAANEEPQIIATAGGVEYVDKQVKPGVSYVYAVQAVAASAESLRSASVTASMRDVFPPAAPANLAAVAGLSTIELTWDRVPDAGVSAYRVYRAKAGEEFSVLAESVPIPAYTDRNPQSKTRYRYAVSALDEAGNESPRSEPIEVTAP
jgi:hypothetical protein